MLKLLLILLIFFFVLLLFFFTHRKRNTPASELCINPSNKDPKKGLNFYLDEALDYFYSLNYRVEQVSHKEWKLYPPALLSLKWGEAHIIRDELELIIVAPYHNIKHLESLLDLKKIFL